MKFFSILFLSFFALNQISAQFAIEANPIESTNAAERAKSYIQHQKLAEQSLVKNIPFRSVGPWVQSGRVADLAVDEKDPSHFYVAYATGGLFKTVSNGSSFEPLFDNQSVITLGHVAVHFGSSDTRNSKNDIIWAGSGEQNSSRSSYAGNGIYKSSDGGKTFTNTGLAETQHISRIVLHPTDANTVWVAALGHLYSPNKERGIYKTIDGGKTWKQTLFVDENTGAVDLVIDKNNPQTLYASTWSRTRRAWNFYGNGKGSGIYKSIDGGENWVLISDEKSGFPQGIGSGRIGLSIGYQPTANSQQPTAILFTVVDNQNTKPKKEKENRRKPKSDITKEQLKKMSDNEFMKLDKKAISDFLEANDFPEKYKSEDIVAQMKAGKISTQTLYEYIDKDDDGFSNTSIFQAEVYRFDDAAKNFTKTHTDDLDGIFSTYGYYFAQIRVDPSDINKLYVIGTRLIKSDDGGKTWKSITKDNVHWDGHALWIDPNRSGHIIYGNDGGLNMSYDDGNTWTKCNSLPLAQFYHVTVDMKEPYNVYGGIQDNGVWFGPSTAKPNNRWQESGDSEFKSIMGGDGMQTMVDTRDNTTVYTGYQFGESYRISTVPGKKPKPIKPKHDLGEKPLRFNWQTPILLSQFNQDILYYGANRLYRSMNKGDDWEAISPDLTNGAKKITTEDKKIVTGNVPYGTLTCIHESPLKFGLIYVGTDDGNIQITQDGGVNWKKVSDKLPQNLWVSRVQASAFDKPTVYASLNGYRWDNFGSYLFVSKNYGETWEKIGTDLPQSEPINVVKEDPKNENILYVGTDLGLYVSMDKGKTFQAFGMNDEKKESSSLSGRSSTSLPNVPVHDLVIHPRDNEIVVATHGRSFYIASVNELQQLTSENLKKDLLAFDIKKIKQSSWGKIFDKWEPNEDPKIELPLYVANAGKVRVSIKSGKDLVLNEFTRDVTAGMNYLDYDLTFDEKNLAKYQSILNDAAKENSKDGSKNKIELKKADNEKFYLQKGKYTVVYDKDGETSSKDLIIE